tara:strand:- start:736 stop:1596 length:861 start_codon:yes stop_codon:yes gene_type:complete
MKTDNWISIKSVLPFVYDSIDEALLDEGILYEWCYSAWDKMEIHTFTIDKTMLLGIKDYKTKLPCDLQKLEMVLAKTNLKDGLEDVKTCSSAYEGTDLNWYKNNPDASLYSYFYNRNWLPMKRPTGKFQLSFDQCSGDIINFENSCRRRCNHEYRLLPNGTFNYLQTSFKEGVIAIAYRAKLMEGDDYLIPDDTHIKEAIKSYCMMRLWESRWNSKEEGAGERFRFYSTDWPLKKAIAQGKYKMPDLEELEQLRIQETKMIRTTEQFNNHFADLASPELINLLNLH